MQFKHAFCAIAMSSLLSLGVAPVFGQTQTPTAPDNTKVNERDRTKSSQTADNAKDNAADREMMQKIRQSVMDDKSLSTYAHNVKIIAKNGKVTLKGPVRSEDERKSIVQKAQDAAGPGNVLNQLTVKPETGK
ncbi:MAG TPA: BON domain-containing protein [Bryobacteraceae bacterium]|nr:BON domain-containing protein [Bryobacteraceae bacterium]